MKKYIAALVAGFAFCMAVPATSYAASENDFYRELSRSPGATNEDVVRAVARFKGYKGAGGWAAESDYLIAQGVKIRRNMILTPRAPATKGDAAGLMMNAMESAADKRGLFGRLFPRSRRFAARDGMAQSLLPAKSYMGEFMSGAELLAMLGRAVEQMGKIRE